MVRTTLNLDPSVLAELKRRAKPRQKALGDVASEELAEKFKREAASSSWPPPGWITKNMGEPAIPLEDKDTLWEFFDREVGPHPVSVALDANVLVYSMRPDSPMHASASTRCVRHSAPASRFGSSSDINGGAPNYHQRAHLSESVLDCGDAR